jgi:hypothetical protein
MLPDEILPYGQNDIDTHCYSRHIAVMLNGVQYRIERALCSVEILPYGQNDIDRQRFSKYSFVMLNEVKHRIAYSSWCRRNSALLSEILLYGQNDIALHCSSLLLLSLKQC